MKDALKQKVKSLSFKRISIFQPSLLVGQRADFRFLEKVGAWFMFALCIIPILLRYRPITADQVAAKIILTSQQSGDLRELFHLDQMFIE